MKIFPAIDLMGGKCVRLTQGDYALKKEYNANPLEVARMFESHGFKYLHVVDLDGARTGKVAQWETIENITTNTSLVVDAGGGIKSKEDLKRLFAIGVARANVGSVAARNPETVYEWIDEFGSDRIILSADVREGMIAIDGWRERSGIDVFSFIEQYVEKGISYVTCTDITTDGTMKGPGMTLYRNLVERFPALNLIASGGVGSIQHLADLRDVGVYGVVVGKAIYENKIALEDLSKF